MHLDPTVRGRGIGTAMFAWQRRRIAELAASMAQDRPVIASAYIYGQDLGGQALVESGGFRRVRRSAELVRPNLDAIPNVPTPDGIEVRSIDPTDTALIRRVWEAGVDAFSEHWG